MKLTINLTDEEYEKLQALAKARKKTPEDCLRGFIRACQPHGGGWTPPGQGEQKK